MLTRSKSKMSSLQDLHNIILTLQNEQKESSAKIIQLENEMATKETKIQSLESRVEILEGNVAFLRNTCNLLDRKCDDNEQYSRRPSLRISNIPSAGNEENADKCVELVVDLLNKIPNVQVSRYR